MLIVTKVIGFGYSVEIQSRGSLQVNLEFAFPAALRACLFSIEIELMW